MLRFASRVIEEGIHEKLVYALGLLDEADRRALLRVLDRLVARLGEPRAAARRPPSGKGRPSRKSGYPVPSEPGRQEEA